MLFNDKIIMKQGLEMIYLPPNLFKWKNEVVLMCYLMIKSLQNFDFKMIYLPPNFFE